MQSNPEYHSVIHPALTSFADECCATLGRLTGYVGALVLLGIMASHFWQQFQYEEAAGPTEAVSRSERPQPADGVSQTDS